MPWPKKYRLQPGSIQSGTDKPVRARRVNRHNWEYRGRLFPQAVLLENEEYENMVSLDPPDPPVPLRGVRRKGESKEAVMACNEYLMMPRRSLQRLRNSWLEEERLGLSCKTPTLDTFKSWSRRYQWQARAVLHDSQTKEGIRERLNVYRRVMGSITGETLKELENLSC